MEAYEKVRNTKLYQAFRKENYPTHYNEYKTSADFDVNISTIIFVFLSIAISILLILPGFRGKERIFVAIRCITALFIGLFIFLCNFENGWESDEIHVSTQYKAGISEHINASIGLHIGLRGINITLKGMPENQIGETIKFNEHYSWEWNQGRHGYGPQAGQFHKEFRSSQFRGLPYPILWIAEYFTYDGEGIRFGRNYRIAGWYSHIMIWLAFPIFILSLILFQMVIQYGALFLMLTGISLITANILFSSIRNAIPLRIPFEHYMSGETNFLDPHYSWCYYSNLCNGIICVILGMIAFFSDLRYPDETAQFFGIDVLQSYEDYFADVNELEKLKGKVDKVSKTKDIECDPQIYAGLRKRTTISNRLSRLQKSTVRKKPMTHPRSVVSNSETNEVNSTKSQIELPLYENFDPTKHFEPIGEEAEDNQL